MNLYVSTIGTHCKAQVLDLSWQVWYLSLIVGLISSKLFNSMQTRPHSLDPPITSLFIVKLEFTVVYILCKIY